MLLLAACDTSRAQMVFVCLLKACLSLKQPGFYLFYCRARSKHATISGHVHFRTLTREEGMLRTSVIVVASFIAGVSVVQVLHAQGRAPVYSVSVIDIKDNDGYKNAVPDVRKRIADMGGKYLVAAGVAGSGEIMVDGEKAPS